jgi:2'-5' RNA ligase
MPAGVHSVTEDEMNQRAHIYEQLEAMLTAAQLGDVASDHTAELNGFQGWNYVAITAVGKLAARSIVEVYQDESPEYREVRKTLRLKYGTEWRKKSIKEVKGELLTAEHPIYKVLRRPNPYQTGSSFLWERVQQLRLHGSSIVFNRPNVMRTKTVERYNIPLALCTPIQPGWKGEFPNGGIRILPQRTNWYRQGSVDFSPLRMFYGAEIPVEMLSIARYPHPYFRGDGASVTAAISKWIDTSSLIDDTRVEYYSEGPQGKIVFNADTDDTDQLNSLERRLNDKMGPQGPRVVVVGKSGQVITQRTAEEMGFDNTFTQMRTGIYSAHGVSRALTGDQDSMTYGGLSASLYAAAMLSVQPDMDLIADEDTLDIGPEYGQNLTVEYDVPGIEDPELEDRRLEADATKGAITVGEYRTERGRPLFGNEYDNYIMTASGPVAPDQMMKGKPAPSMPQMPPLQLSKQRKSVIQVSPIAESAPKRADIEKLSQAGYRVAMPGEEITVDVQGPFIIWDVDIQPTAVELLDELPESEERRALQSILEEKQGYKYGCVMLQLPAPVADAMLSMSVELPDSIIGAGGREDQPHVTLLYGITGCDLETVIANVSKMTAPTITFRSVSTFPAGEYGIPLKLDVESPQLQTMNATLRKVLPHVETYPDYKPHATICYVCEGAEILPSIFPLDRLNGVSCIPTHAIVSMPGQPKAVVPLRPQVQAVELSPLAKSDPAKLVDVQTTTKAMEMVERLRSDFTQAFAAQNQVLAALVEKLNGMGKSPEAGLGQVD